MDHRRTRQLLSCLGVPEADSITAELGAEAANRVGEGESPRGLRIWWAVQVASLVAHALKDRIAGNAGPPVWRGFRPAHALGSAIRSIRWDRASAATGALTLAVGFGAAATIFAVWQGFSRPLPVPEGHRVVQVRILDQARRTYPTVWTDLSTSGPWVNFHELGAFQTWSPVVVDGQSQPHRAAGARVTPEGLRSLDVRPVLGRLPDPGELGVVLLGYEEWNRTTGADESVVGRVIRIDGAPRTVVGVMPQGFAFPFAQALWVPLEPRHGGEPVEVFGRLREGATREAATGEVRSRFSRVLPQGARIDVLGFTEGRGEGGENAGLLAVLALVVVLLFVSCSSVSNLLLIRGLDRSGQLAVHQAVGASPLQVAWLVLTESLLITCLGAVVGFAIAWGAVRYIEKSLSGHWGYYWMEVGLQPAVFLFLALLAVVTAILAGSVPAVRAFRADVRGGLSAGGPGAGSARVGWIGPALLTGQVGMSFLFLLAAVLMARGLVATNRVNPAFPAEQVYMAGVTWPASGSESGRREFREALDRALRSNPIVQHSALATGIPGFRVPIYTLESGGTPRAASSPPIFLTTYGTTPGFFDVFGITRLEGRLIQAGDNVEGADPVVVVSRAFAQEQLGTLNAVGQRIGVSAQRADTAVTYEVVGVVEDIRIYREVQRGYPIYIPLIHDPSSSVYALYRPKAEAQNAEGVVGSAVASIDPELAVDRTLISDQGVPVLDILNYIRTIYSTAGYMGILGGVAAVLVAVAGLYGILSYEMRRRKRELGIRIALGAGRRRIMGQVVRRGLRSIAPGLVLGTLAASAGLPLLGVLLGGEGPAKAALLVTVTLAYAGVASLTSLVPAMRAARVDPNATLRAD